MDKKTKYDPKIIKKIIDYAYEKLAAQHKGEITKDTVAIKIAEFIKEELK